MWKYEPTNGAIHLSAVPETTLILHTQHRETLSLIAHAGIYNLEYIILLRALHILLPEGPGK